MKKPIAFLVLGTRPEIIKTYPLIKPLKKYYRVKVIFTGQHFLALMTDRIFKNLNYPKPDYYLRVKEFNHALQITQMVSQLTKIIQKEQPKFILVQGDTNSTLAGALAAVKNNCQLVHIEAGARCFNKAEPEEINRILVDHMAHLNFSFSKYSKKNLISEGLRSVSYDFPNTIYETCSLVKNTLSSDSVLKKLKLKKKSYVLVTVHRKSNLNKQTFTKLVGFLNELCLAEEIVFPIHPSAQIILKKFKLELNPRIRLIDPLDYHDFLVVLKDSRYIISDSGGVVDESNFFNIPLFIYRNETERQEMIDSKRAILLHPLDSNSNKLKKILLFNNKFKRHANQNYHFCQKIVQKIHQELA